MSQKTRKKTNPKNFIIKVFFLKHDITLAENTAATNAINLFMLKMAKISLN